MVIIKSAAPPSLRRLSDSLWSTGTFGTRDSATNIMNDPVMKAQRPWVARFLCRWPDATGCFFDLLLLFRKGLLFCVKYRAATGSKTSLIYACWQQFIPQSRIHRENMRNAFRKWPVSSWFIECIVKCTFFLQIYLLGWTTSCCSEFYFFHLAPVTGMFTCGLKRWINTNPVRFDQSQLEIGRNEGIAF